MNAGLVTFYHIHHYGALLQAAATVRAVRALGHKCALVNYYVRQDNDLFRRSAAPADLAANAHTALHYRVLSLRAQRFEAFAAANLPRTPRRYLSLDELRAEPLSYDVILAGSDQIWNPKIFPDGRFDPVFFGAFSAVRKIAYAPSFGVPSLPEGMEAELKTYLADFTHLSVREAQGRAILQKIGRDAPVVLDPTLLLTAQEWDAMASRASDLPQGGYLLCYCVSDPAALTPYVRALAEKTGLPVVQLCGTRRKVVPGAKQIFSAGPAEFLTLFSRAEYVVTNSFHGTVFAVQYEKPFFTAVSPAETAAPERSRTYSLLSSLGIAERIVGTGESASLDEEVDWAAVRDRLTAQRRASMAYLKAALENLPYEAEQTAPRTDAPTLASPVRCTGCTACAAVCPKDAITLRRDREGFDVPSVDLSLCVRCGKCTAVCPALRERGEEKALPAAYAAWIRDDAARRDSTSGGVFTAIARSVLEDGGAVYGAAFDVNQHLRHIAVFSEEELPRLRGAKYVQSDLRGVFREIASLLKSRPVLFSGTPCQVDGLYRYLGERPENLITCDLVCQGVPSPGVWEDYARALEADAGRRLRAVRFRNKVDGWKTSHFTAVYEDGRAESAPLFETEYGRAYGRGLMLRRSCAACPYTNLNRVGDFTLGDLWGLRDDELPDEQTRGVSLLLVNTARASYLFDRLPLSREPYPPERAVAGNPRLASPMPASPARTAFFAAYAAEPFEQVRKEWFRLPPRLAREAAKLLSPEWKERAKKLLKK
ncbi:MAG: polysaccharide pyruvyl transferase family protein [Oscillibacter sp.]|nr:polysaccharide pyruvyl transferase family protein [Oscillibacter sp.]